MIFKKIAARSKQKSESNRIKRLIEYVTNPQGARSPDQDEHHSKTEKCTYFRAVNYLCDPSNIKQLCIETTDLAEQKHANASHVFCHYLLSFESNYKPTNSEIDLSVNVLIERFEMKECQYIFARHDDTDNTHVHILINRVNPTTYQAHRINGGFDITAGQEAREIIERVLKLNPLTKNNLASYLPIELNTGFQSKNRIIHEMAINILEHSRTWQYFHLLLNEKNLEIRPSRTGLAISYGSYFVQASDIDGRLSKKSLEAKFGPFQPSQKPYLTDFSVDNQFVPLKLITEDKLRSALFAVYQEKHTRSIFLRKKYLEQMELSLESDIAREKAIIENKIKQFSTISTEESVLEVALKLHEKFEIFKQERKLHWSNQAKELPPEQDYYFDQWCKKKNIDIKKFYNLNQALSLSEQRLWIRINPNVGTPLDEIDFLPSELSFE